MARREITLTLTEAEAKSLETLLHVTTADPDAAEFFGGHAIRAFARVRDKLRRETKSASA